MFRLCILFSFLLCVFCDVTPGFAQSGLVGHWRFDEGAGNRAYDYSGQNNHGAIYNAKWISQQPNACLEFDGQTSYVDCGNSQALDLTNSFTLQAWIFPTAIPRGEAGILGKGFDRYFLTYYKDGQVYFYVGAGGNNAKAPVPSGVWTFVAATFDGKIQRLYVNGQLVDSHISRYPAAPTGGRFVIGCVPGNNPEGKPDTSQPVFFEGLIDDVRIYNRPLTEEEIKQQAQAQKPQFEIVREFSPVQAVCVLKGVRATIKAGDTGAIQIQQGNESVVLASFYSYPGEKIGWNALGLLKGCQPGWKPRVKPLGNSGLEIWAESPLYSLRRKLSLHANVLEIEDTLANKREEPVGLICRHELISSRRFVENFCPGGPEAPILYLRMAGGALGIVMEDNLSRMRFEGNISAWDNLSTFRLSNMAVPSKGKLIFRWAIMLMPAQSSYWDFVNALRRRWRVNNGIEGPLSWIDMEDPLLSAPQRLQAYLQRKKVHLMLLSPWLDYDPGRHDRVWPREEYKEKAIAARQKLKSVQPDIKVLGCIETDWVTIYPEKIPGGEKLPVFGKGSGGLNREQTEIIEKSGLPFVDSLKYGPDRTTFLELYMRGGKPQTALSVYPALGNYQYEFLMGQIKFLLDECGLDGFYIDEFSQGWGGPIKNYGGWDGFSVDVDPLTGRINDKWIDCSLAGLPARLNLVNYALQRGKIVVANTYATAMEENPLPVYRFAETWNLFDPMLTPDGQKPPLLPALCRSHLGSMIGLGILGHPELQDTARRLMKAVVTYLRHAMLYYHYFIEDIPEQGPGSGEYGPINHMFPITPLELGEGFIRGKERIITCISGQFRWEQARRPLVLGFDLNGRPAPIQASLKQTGPSWQITLSIQDWAQIAVIE